MKSPAWRKGPVRALLAALGLGPQRHGERAAGQAAVRRGPAPNADAIEAQLLAAGEPPAAVRRATVLGRPVGDVASPLLALDLVFRPPPTVHVLWALADEGTQLLIEDCQNSARDGALGWMTDILAVGHTGGRRLTPSLTPP
ncbi:hypothetical protein [Streptomyces sp. NBC_01800]|uniref:hypothetical protein n=1 Tax=Streptomyces sp. NBC_01800 TaxID=2975945 RepID=UPI002DD91C0D|nr:hypothetical protein [Streptomyces sp. NBC_01800]WSA72954.1 relaxase domain-containing protein [Streptomyces sp. NBC_01800]